MVYRKEIKFLAKEIKGSKARLYDLSGELYSVLLFDFKHELNDTEINDKVAPLIHVMSKDFGIEKIYLSIVKIEDNPNKMGFMLTKEEVFKEYPNLFTRIEK